MPDLDQPRVPLPRLKTGGKRRFAETGTALANIDIIPSDGLITARDNSKITARFAGKTTWGGARNRRDRTSWHLTLSQCEGLIAATERAERQGLPFNRHWTIHYERAGIAESDGARFIGHVLKLARDYASRAGKGRFAAVWVRESGEGKGGHVHILMHLPTGCTLQGRSRKWVRLAGGTYRTGVSFARSIGGNLKAAQSLSEHYRQNAATVLAYVLKGASREAGETARLPQCGEGGLIIGKRCGWSQNVGMKQNSINPADATPAAR